MTEVIRKTSQRWLTGAEKEEILAHIAALLAGGAGAMAIALHVARRYGRNEEQMRRYVKQVRGEL